MEIPREIVDQMTRIGEFAERPDPESTKNELLSLGVSEHSEIFCFCMKYVPAGILDSACLTELIDPSSPATQMRWATDFVREVCDVSHDFICVSTTEGEGFFLLGLQTGGVYDVELPDVEKLNKGELVPTWGSFFDFIEWYLFEEDTSGMS